MTAPAIWPGTDLDSITFSDEERRPSCECRECSAEALYVAILRSVNHVACHLNLSPKLCCLRHKDLIMELHRLHGILGNSFTCPRVPGSKLTLARMESIR